LASTPASCPSLIDPPFPLRPLSRTGSLFPFHGFAFFSRVPFFPSFLPNFLLGPFVLPFWCTLTHFFLPMGPPKWRAFLPPGPGTDFHMSFSHLATRATRYPRLPHLPVVFLCSPACISGVFFTCLPPFQDLVLSSFSTHFEGVHAFLNPTLLVWWLCFPPSLIVFALSSPFYFFPALSPCGFLHPPKASARQCAQRYIRNLPPLSSGFVGEFIMDGSCDPTYMLASPRKYRILRCTSGSFASVPPSTSPTQLGFPPPPLFPS